MTRQDKIQEVLVKFQADTLEYELHDIQLEEATQALSRLIDEEVVAAEQRVGDRVFSWLGVYRDDLSPEAISNLQNIATLKKGDTND